MELPEIPPGTGPTEGLVDKALTLILTLGLALGLGFALAVGVAAGPEEAALPASFSGGCEEKGDGRGRWRQGGGGVGGHSLYCTAVQAGTASKRRAVRLFGASFNGPCSHNLYLSSTVYPTGK